MNGPLQTYLIQLLNVILFELVLAVSRSLPIDPSTQRSRRNICRSVVGRNIPIPITPLFALHSMNGCIERICLVKIRQGSDPSSEN